MKYMGLNDIREAYLRFFESKDHLRLPSFSLVPKSDPSILLINAGMTPLKPYFTGVELPPRLRVTSCQKCIRTQDIEQVGHTARHGTYFEMLGNFSFGDYFKLDAIKWAWEFATEHLEMEADRLHITVYEEDDEAYNIWHDVIGLSEDRVTRLGKEDNFWEHGTGPSGPDSELFYDRGPAYGCGQENCGVTCECDRYIEFWNLVFTQFDRQEDGTYLPLEKKNIDTGAGLERIAAIMQGVNSLFEVDTVRRVLDKVCELAGTLYGQDAQNDVAIRVITDHIRSTTMMISDGILPSNEGRGYVLRRLLRRAARYGRLLGINRLFLNDLTPVVIDESKFAYPELEERRSYILSVIQREEERFERTISQGSGLLDEAIRSAKEEGKKILAGAEVFRLHDTYGFPLDLTREIAEEAGLDIDREAFQLLMKQQKEQARAALAAKGSNAWGGASLPEEISQLAATSFTGYDRLSDDAVVLLLAVRDEDADSYVSTALATVDHEVIVVTDRTPFYGEGGGQVGDIGLIQGENGLKIRIDNTTKTAENVFLHYGKVLQGNVETGNTVHMEVDRKTRMATMRNHTTTHLLHKALRTVLGEHVTQAGSLVDPHKLRFDFAHYQAMKRDEIREVERLVNEAILADYPVQSDVMSIQDAKKSGAMALFDEKYGDAVRVISIGDYSKELCGGTHLSRSSQAALFKILSEQSIASGVRRIEAVTGDAAVELLYKIDDELKEAAESLKTSPEDLILRISNTVSELRSSHKKIAELEAKLTQAASGNLYDEAFTAGDYKILIAAVSANSMDSLRDLAASARDKLAPSIVLLAADIGGKLNFIAMATKESVNAGIHCGQIIKVTAAAAGGGGGGRPDMAQAGGKNPEQLPQALAVAKDKILEQLG